MEFYIYWDKDYNGSDIDELLDIVNSEEEKEKFIDDWCIRKANSMLQGLHGEETEKFTEEVKNLFRKQLFVMNKPRYK